MQDICVVTGGAGFIGSHLVQALLANGKRVRILDNFDTGQLSNLAHLQPAPEVIRGSVTDPKIVDEVLRDADLVFHLAAMASVAKSLEEPKLCHEICATGTLNVLEAARKCGVRRVVYAGSSSAYGLASDPSGQSEETPLKPLSPYAAAKLAGEHYLEAFTASFGLETVRLRFFNIFGPRQRADSPYSGVIALFAAALSTGRIPMIHGDGLQTRDFTDVSNAVRALLLAAETPGIAGRVYNVGTGRSVTLLELIAALNNLLGTTIVPTHGPARVGDVRHSLARIDRIRKDLGYEPVATFEDGLKRTLNWYRSGAS